MKKIREFFKTFSELRTQKEFMKNTVAISLSSFGDGIEAIAYPMLVYKLTGSTLLMAGAFALNALPNVLFGIISGVFSMKRDEKWIIAFCDLGSGIAFALTAILFQIHILTVWESYLFSFINASMLAFRSPASFSIFPRILEQKYMERAIALKGAVVQTFQMLGVLLATSIIALMGITTAIMIDSISFFFCAGIIMTLKVPKKEKKEASMKENLLEVKNGFLYVAKNATIFQLCLFACALNAFLVPLEIYQVPYVQTALQERNYLLSFMGASGAIAMTTGSMISPMIREKLGSKKTLLFSGIIMTCGYLVLPFLANTNHVLKIGAVCVAMFLLGAGSAIAGNVLQMMIYDIVKSEFLSRVGAVLNMMACLSMPLASLISGVALIRISLMDLFLFCSIIVLLVNVVNFYFCKYETMHKVIEVEAP